MRYWTRTAEFFRTAWPALAGLAAVFLFLEPTPFELRVDGLSFDQWCADAWYWPGIGRWTLGHAGPARLLFYDGPKVALIVLSVAAGVRALLPERFLPGFLRTGRLGLPRRDALYLVLCLALVPLVCNRIKAVSNVYCPYENTRYGGKAPYVRVIESYPEPFRSVQAKDPKERGRAFPAGHAAGGFSLLALAYVLRSRRTGLAIGLAAGWAMGLYQMMRGAHYLSHTLTTWAAAWLMVVLLAVLLRPSGFRPERRAPGT